MGTRGKRPWHPALVPLLQQSAQHRMIHILFCDDLAVLCHLTHCQKAFQE